MTAQQLKNSILQLAVQGKLVPQDKNDEPASVLLERIKAEKQALIKAGKIKKEKPLPPITEEEIPFDIPEDWEWCRLSDLGVTQTGNTPSKSNPANFGNYIPFIGPGDISDGVIDYNNHGLSEQGKELGRVCSQYSIIQVCIGGSIGKAAITDREITFNQQLNTITAILCDYKYLYYSMISDYFVSFIKANAGGTATPIINRGLWDKILIPVPPLAEQHRIVAKIEELLPYIEKYDKAETKLTELNTKFPDALKKSILQEAVQGKLIPQDPNDEPASVLLERIKAEKQTLIKAGKIKKEKPLAPITEEEIPFDIPESWEWCRLGFISTYNQTKQKINAKDADESLWGLDLEDIEKGGNLLVKKSVGERKAVGDKTLFNKGDILYSKLRPYLLKILIAPDNGICTPEIVPFTVYGGISAEYIVNFLKSPYVDGLVNGETYGVKMPRAGTETMISLLVPIPPLEEQKRIVAKIEELMPFIGNLTK